MLLVFIIFNKIHRKVGMFSMKKCIMGIIGPPLVRYSLFKIKHWNFSESMKIAKIQVYQVDLPLVKGNLKEKIIRKVWRITYWKYILTYIIFIYFVEKVIKAHTFSSKDTKKKRKKNATKIFTLHFKHYKILKFSTEILFGYKNFKVYFVSMSYFTVLISGQTPFPLNVDYCFMDYLTKQKSP